MLAEFKKELPGILNWVIQGYKSYKENGLIVPEIVHNSTQEYRKETDSLGTFIEENCASSTKYNCSLKVFTKAYIDWCEENNEYASSKNSKQIASLLRSRCYDIARGTGNKTFIRGLKLSVNNFADDMQLLS